MKYKLIKNRKLLEDKSFFSKNKWFAGYNKENRAEVLEFEIPTSLSNYTKKINFELPDGNFFDLLENDNSYVLKNNITKYDKVRFYLEFTKEIEQNHIEVIKTEVKDLEFGDSFDVDNEITQEEINIIQTIITQAGDAIRRANAISEDLENKVATDYYRGEKGDDATINGYNNIELVAGENIRITMINNRIIISATGVTPPTPTSDVQYITSDNSIFLTSDNLNFIVMESD